MMESMCFISFRDCCYFFNNYDDGINVFH